MTEFTILMPCLNEEKTIGSCIDEAKKGIAASKISAEILVADNGSSDRSAFIAREHGARVVNVAEKGYGSALIGGIKAAQGKYIIMGDCDMSYDFSDIGGFVQKLREGYGLVMGNRFGGIEKGAMSFSHRYFGVPLLSLAGRIRYHTFVTDFHCGIRGFDRLGRIGGSCIYHVICGIGAEVAVDIVTYQESVADVICKSCYGVGIACGCAYIGDNAVHIGINVIL